MITHSPSWQGRMGTGQSPAQVSTQLDSRVVLVWVVGGVLGSSYSYQPHHATCAIMSPLCCLQEGGLGAARGFPALQVMSAVCCVLQGAGTVGGASLWVCWQPVCCWWPLWPWGLAVSWGTVNIWGREASGWGGCCG